ncbi:hypothetical protein SD77_3199 [Bacillus badius]|uniref:Mobile element protein n=1 Tax=Bacillus badius TaxID=1455 RepID=A0ABR5AX89_BACBA|nr:hypothetical protein SD77_3199 [Bacillus badius]
MIRSLTNSSQQIGYSGRFFGLVRQQIGLLLKVSFSPMKTKDSSVLLKQRKTELSFLISNLPKNQA